jgi:hypothetical protein
MMCTHRRYVCLAARLGLMAFLFTACATQPPPVAAAAPGFLMGLIHGFTSLFALIGELFTDYRVYAFPNSGGLYDLGFVVGAAVAFGGSHRVRVQIFRGRRGARPQY